MNEERYASRIRQALNYGLKDISPASARRLEASRHLALARQKAPAREVTFATGGSGFHLPSGFHDARWLRPLLAALALLLGMWISFYLDSNRYVSEIEEIDSALLADDLPIEALLDKDVFQWLKDDSPD